MYTFIFRIELAYNQQDPFATLLERLNRYQQIYHEVIKSERLIRYQQIYHEVIKSERLIRYQQIYHEVIIKKIKLFLSKINTYFGRFVLTIHYQLYKIQYYNIFLLHNEREIMIYSILNTI